MLAGVSMAHGTFSACKLQTKFFNLDYTGQATTDGTLLFLGVSVFREDSSLGWWWACRY
jgi:hypothetical protein